MKDITIMKNNFVRIAIVTVGILMIPLLARFPWTLSDFIVMGILISSVGTLVELARTKVRNKTHRIALIAGFVFLGLWLWVELAVGLFTNWGS
jgi:hypothetical protein